MASWLIENEGDSFDGSVADKYNIGFLDSSLHNLEVADIGLHSSVVAIASIEVFQGCLLYTSPSPRDLSTSRMPSSA